MITHSLYQGEFSMPAGEKIYFGNSLVKLSEFIEHFNVTVFKLNPNCFHMHKKLCFKVIALIAIKSDLFNVHYIMGFKKIIMKM